MNTLKFLKLTIFLDLGLRQTTSRKELTKPDGTQDVNYSRISSRNCLKVSLHGRNNCNFALGFCTSKYYPSVLITFWS